MTPEVASTLVEAQFPELAPVDIVPFGSGWDNEAFLVNGAFVFRFPRRTLALAFFENELRVLGGLAGRLPLPIPRPIYLGKPDPEASGFPWPFAGYLLIVGRTACSRALSDDARARCAGPLGAFLGVLHAIPVDEAERMGAGPDAIRRMELGYRTERLRGNIAKIEALGGPRPPSNWEAIVDAALRQETIDVFRSLVHGDLYVRHLLIDEKGALCGIIDWGDCHIGNPAIDLAIAHSFLPPSTHPLFRAAYGDIDDATWGLARWRALQHTSMLALFAVDVGDVDLLRECETTFRFLET